MRLGLVVGLGLFTAFSGCSSSSAPDANTLSTTFVLPAGLLDTVTRLQVLAFDSGATTCKADDGTVTGDGAAVPVDTKKSLANKDLSATNCKAGEKFCGDLQIDPDPAKSRVFVALAYTSDGKTFARGCQNLAVKSGSNQLLIKMFRLIPPATCGGKPSPYKVTQCDPPGNAMDPVCDAECLTKEQFLSHGSGNPGQTSSTKPKEKASFVWPSSGDATAGRFIAFAGDQSQTARRQVSMRVLDPDMIPCVGAKCVPDRGGFVQLNSFFIPNDPNNFDLSTQSGDPQSQYNPAGAYASDKYFVAFEDGTGNMSRIALRTIKPDLSAEQAVGQPVGLTMGTGQKRPAIGLNGAGKLFVAWEANGEIRGRTVDPGACAVMCSGALGTEQLIGSGTKPSVAGTAAGFVVAYQAGVVVKFRSVDGTGAPGMEVDVSTNGHTGNQESPAVAALSTGVIGVVWRDSSNGGIFAHRYTPALAIVTGEDPTGARVNDVTKANDSAQPTITAGSGAGGAYFGVAWVDNVTGHIRGRFLDGAAGFLFNPVDGQTSEFQVTRTDAAPGARQNPTIAIGGSAPYVAIGWDDNSGAGTGDKGIYARRFPVPLK